MHSIIWDELKVILWLKIEQYLEIDQYIVKFYSEVENEVNFNIVLSMKHSFNL